MMDQSQRVLFGKFPRRVATPEQDYVYSEGEFDVWRDTVNGRRNAYSTISWFPINWNSKPRYGIYCDKVSYDFDAPEKETAFPDGTRADEKVDMMRESDYLAERVLDEVCEDARALANRSLDDEIPIVGVFSGFGIHAHQLFEPEEDPKEKMGSVARYYQDDLGLNTIDPKVIGDIQRILRVPNMRRVHLKDVLDYRSERWECNLWTVPLTGRELANVTPEDLMDLSLSPRPEALTEPNERPTMPLYEDYTREEAVAYEERELEIDPDELGKEDLRWILENTVRMPCMVERALQPSPSHEVRQNLAVMLYNLDMTPDEVYEIIAALNWRDFNPSITKQQLRQIYRKGYSDMSCRTVQRLGLCTRTEDPESCPTYGWSGGQCEWK